MNFQTFGGAWVEVATRRPEDLRDEVIIRMAEAHATAAEIGRAIDRSRGYVCRRLHVLRGEVRHVRPEAFVLILEGSGPWSPGVERPSGGRGCPRCRGRDPGMAFVCLACSASNIDAAALRGATW